MSQQGEAAEQVVNMATNITIKGVECVTNLAGKGAMSLVSLYSHCTHTALYVCRRTIRQCWKELFEKLCRRVFGGGDHGAWLRDIRRLCG